MKRRDHVCGVMESCFAPSHSLRRLDDDGASCLFAELDARNFRKPPNCHELIRVLSEFISWY